MSIVSKSTVLNPAVIVSGNEYPYSHRIVSNFFDPELAQIIAHWFETFAQWELTITDFYEQYEVDFKKVHFENHPEIANLLNPNNLLTVRKTMETWFGCTLEDVFEITAHKLVKDQTIRIHNDFLPQDPVTHRLVVQFNNAWTEQAGGYLMTFSSGNPGDVVHLLPPLCNSAFGFKISETSYHAVSTVHADERYTLVFTFKETS